MCVMVTMKSEADLLEMILTAHSGRRLPNALHGRQSESDEQRDDGDDDEKLDQGHRPPGNTQRSRDSHGPPGGVISDGRSYSGQTYTNP